MIDFAPLADSYDRLRPAGRAWEAVAERSLHLLGTPARLLDVGCGTGRFARLAADRTGARVWAVDPSERMLDAARKGGGRIGWRRASAERLPFRDAWFDAVHLHLVIHLVEDRRAAFAELGRVLAPGGRLVVATFDPAHIRGFYLNRWFPSIERIDLARFPEPAAILAELAAAGLTNGRSERLLQRVQLAPKDVVERVRGRYISTLHLLPEAEYAGGMAKLEAELGAATKPLEAVLDWRLVVAEAPAA